jgi:predicted MFS family arabinose efflux permease
VGIASCVGSALVADPSALIVLRLFFGIASGMIAAATNAIPPLGREPERVFAYMQVAIGIVFGLAVYIAGVVQGIFGRSSVFVVELAFFVVFGAGALLLPEARVAGSSTSTIESRKLSAPVWAGISSVALMWIALAGAWAFAQQAGAAVQLSIESTAGWMSIGGFLTPLGAVAAALIGERYGYSRPLLIGFLFQIAVMIALYCLGNPAAYLTSLILLNFPITFIGAYLMGLIGSLEVTGRGTSLAGAAVNFGGAAGPALGAVFLSGRALSRVGWFAAITLALGLALSCVAARHWQKTHR